MSQSCGEGGALMTTRARRLELAYDALHLDHTVAHVLDRSELMRGASRQGSEVTYTLHGTVITAPRTTEVDGLKAAAGLEQPEEAPPLIDVPNKYNGMKFCKACKAWKLKTLFSPLATTIDGKHTYCRDCRAAKKRANYQPTLRWKRG
jgi:hypothetical protein